MRTVEYTNSDLANKFQCSGILRAFVLLAVAVTARVIVMWTSMYMGIFIARIPRIDRVCFPSPSASLPVELRDSKGVSEALELHDDAAYLPQPSGDQGPPAFRGARLCSRKASLIPLKQLARAKDVDETMSSCLTLRHSKTLSLRHIFNGHSLLVVILPWDQCRHFKEIPIR